ncbi:MAG: hypothetical protein LM577_00410 [Thermoproteaceae archaeon]|jgi:hypothetical protein|nr:hypothetical protein [Thermoproteaceae archaeon]
MKPLLLLLTAVAAFSALTAHVVQSGEFLNVTLVLDKAPEGLAGYTINITGGEVVYVNFPPWARLSEWNGGVIKAVDLNDEVRPGAQNVTLAVIALRAGRNATLRVAARIDDDSGNSQFEEIVVTTPAPASRAAQLPLQRAEGQALLWAAVGAAITVSTVIGLLTLRGRRYVQTSREGGQERGQGQESLR